MESRYAEYWNIWWGCFVVLFVLVLGLFGVGCAHWVYGEPFKEWGVSGLLWRAAALIGVATVIGGIPVIGVAAHWWIVTYLVWPWLYTHDVQHTWALTAMGVVGTTFTCFQSLILEAQEDWDPRYGWVVLGLVLSLGLTVFLYFFLPPEWRLILRGY